MPMKFKTTVLDVGLGLIILGLPVVLAGCMVIGLAAAVPVGFALLPPLAALAGAMALITRAGWQGCEPPPEHIAIQP